MAPPLNIVLCYPVEAQHLAQIEAAARGARLIDAGQERIAAELFNADVFCGHAKVPVDWDGVVGQGRLQWIQSSAAGMDHCLVPSVVESPITVTSASGVLADQVVDQTLALLTALLRGMPTFLGAQRRREFIRRPTRDLHHSTIGIVGFGGNGRRLAAVLSAFKTRILATDYFPINKPSYVDELWGVDRLPDLLPLVDILILAAPLTDRTRDLLGARQFATMKRGAILINVARGPLVVEHDLADALESGQLFGAGLDVTYEEPLPESSRLWDLPNCLITPHVGGQSARRIDQMTDFFCENLRRYFDGKPLNNLVDKRLGFPRPAET